MPVCTGASQKKSTSPSFIHVDPLYMATILPVQLLWLKPFLPYIQPMDIDVGAFCSLDPPADPVIDANDIANLLLGPNKATLAFLAGQKVAQLIHIVLWYLLCECASGSPPTAATYPSAPSGLPAVNPSPIVALPTANPCTQTAYDTTFSGSTSSLAGPVLDYANKGVTSLQYEFTNTPTGGVSPTMRVQMIQQTRSSNPTGAITREDNYYLAPNDHRVYDVPFPDPGDYISTVYYKVTGSGTATVHSVISGFCGGTPAGIVGQCAPDQNVLGMLTQILDLVTLIQREHVPFGYIASTQHSGLTGQGSFTVQGLVGLWVQITTLPSYLGIADSTPDRIFDAGFVSVGTDDGYQRQVRISSVSDLWFPDAMGAMTIVGYSAAPNVVLRITELAREP